MSSTSARSKKGTVRCRADQGGGRATSPTMLQRCRRPREETSQSACRGPSGVRRPVIHSAVITRDGRLRRRTTSTLRGSLSTRSAHRSHASILPGGSRRRCFLGRAPRALDESFHQTSVTANTARGTPPRGLAVVDRLIPRVLAARTNDVVVAALRTTQTAANTAMGRVTACVHLPVTTPLAPLTGFPAQFHDGTPLQSQPRCPSEAPWVGLLTGARRGEDDAPHGRPGPRHEVPRVRNCSQPPGAPL
jgi:hypothetical protein